MELLYYTLRAGSCGKVAELAPLSRAFLWDTASEEDTVDCRNLYRHPS